MNFHWPLFRPKPSHTEVRYVAATKAENAEARRLRIYKRLELDIAVVQLTDEQRAMFKARAARGGRG